MTLTELNTLNQESALPLFSFQTIDFLIVCLQNLNTNSIQIISIRFCKQTKKNNIVSPDQLDMDLHWLAGTFWRVFTKQRFNIYNSNAVTFTTLLRADNIKEVKFSICSYFL